MADGVNRDHMIVQGNHPIRSHRFTQQERGRCYGQTSAIISEKSRAVIILCFAFPQADVQQYHMNQQFVVICVSSFNAVDVTLWCIMASMAENITCGGFMFFNNFDSANLAKVEPVRIPENFEKGNTVISWYRNAFYGCTTNRQNNMYQHLKNMLLIYFINKKLAHVCL